MKTLPGGPTATKMGRYYYKMFLISSISFGVHLTRATVPIIGMILIEEGFLSPGGLGVFIGCGFIPSVFVPLYIGYIVDISLQTSKIMTFLLSITVLGEVLFIAAIIMRNYPLAAFAQILFGCGGSSVSAIQRVLVAYHIEDNLAFSTAIYVCMACLSKFIGKGFMGPVAINYGLNIALFLPLFFCCTSLGVYLLFLVQFADDIKLKEGSAMGNKRNAPNLTSTSVDGMHYIELANTPSSIDSAKKLVTPKKANYFQRKRLWEKKSSKQDCTVVDTLSPPSERLIKTVGTIVITDRERRPQSPRRDNELDIMTNVDKQKQLRAETIDQYVIKFFASIFKLQPLVYSYIFMHMIYVITFHLLINFLPSYLVRHWGQSSFTFVGLVSSAPHLTTVILAPVVGLIVDRWGYSLLICLFAALNTVFAFAVLLYSNMSPIIGIAAISISQALIPVLTLAKISQQSTIVTDTVTSPTPGE
jgi:MFS family permease